jgi:hypothetical protein
MYAAQAKEITASTTKATRTHFFARRVLSAANREVVGDGIPQI